MHNLQESLFQITRSRNEGYPSSKWGNEEAYNNFASEAKKFKTLSDYAKAEAKDFRGRLAASAVSNEASESFKKSVAPEINKKLKDANFEVQSSFEQGRYYYYLVLKNNPGKKEPIELPQIAFLYSKL